MGKRQLKQEMVTAAIYARVSTQRQSLEMQLPDLRRYASRQEWEVVEYVEKESSIKKRPVFEQMLRDARAGRFSVILVWRIDRWARSMKDFVATTLLLDEWKVRLVSVTESVDTGDRSPFGKFTISLLGLLAELERNIILARVTAGLDEYRDAYSEGKIGKTRHSRSGKDLAHGRPKLVFRRDEAIRMRDDGLSWRQIAAALTAQGPVRVSVATVRRACAVSKTIQ